ncbi:hypothetical protein RFI41_16500, partial [Acinetobacter nosocomialis]|nr:hypothetical protein [Acinetobacter nosocomialis]
LMFITSFGEQNITYKCCSNFLIHLCNLSNLKDAIIYYRDFKTKKIIEAPEKDSWTCFKQQHDRLDFCVSYN